MHGTKKDRSTQKSAFYNNNVKKKCKVWTFAAHVQFYAHVNVKKKSKQL